MDTNRIGATRIPAIPPSTELYTKVMMIIHVKRGATSTAWKNAIEAMDQLIWSVQPKDTQEDRKKLATIVPPLIKRIGAGLDVAGVEFEVREFFFDALMKAHTQIMSQPLPAKGAGLLRPAATGTYIDDTRALSAREWQTRVTAGQDVRQKYDVDHLGIHQFCF